MLHNNSVRLARGSYGDSILRSTVQQNSKHCLAAGLQQNRGDIASSKAETMDSVMDHIMKKERKEGCIQFLAMLDLAIAQTLQDKHRVQCRSLWHEATLLH